MKRRILSFAALTFAGFLFAGAQETPAGRRRNSGDFDLDRAE